MWRWRVCGDDGMGADGGCGVSVVMVVYSETAGPKI